MSPQEQIKVRPARTWTDFSARRWQKIDRPASNIGKIALEEFVQKHGLPHLKMITLFKTASEVTLQGLPDFFVLKPASLWSGTGVMLLHRISGLTAYFDAKNNKILTENDIISACLRVEQKFQRTLNFIVEERALDEDPDKRIPLDYKVFTFYGVAKFVLQVDRNFSPPRMAFFDGGFDPITDDRVQLNPERPDTQGQHRKPECWKEILDLARQVTIKLEAPFISVDCYATARGPLLGELTHTPGGPWYGGMYKFSDAFDLELGTAWQEANAKLGSPEVTISVPYNIVLKGKTVRTIL